MEAATDSVIVVGAGAFGVASALELVRRGYSVDLLDPGPLPHADAASTDISKMIRMDYGHDEFYTDLAMEAMDVWDRWNAQGPHPLFHEDGFLVLSPMPLKGGSFEGDSYRLLAARGLALERLGDPELTSRFPAWHPGRYVDGYYNRRAGWAESGAVVAWLLDVARGLGVRLHEGVTATALLQRGSRVIGVEAGRQRFEADHVVVAAGAWTPVLLPWLSDVMWASGQPVLHFLAADRAAFQAPAFVPWAADISHTGWYGFPALDDGRVKIGNHGPGIRTDPRDARVVPDWAEPRFRAFLAETFPELADRPVVGRRLCLYCDTFDGDFWIDRDPSRDGLVVAAGGSGHGFKFVTVLGSIVADVLEGRPNRWAQRFRWRDAGPPAKEAARNASALESL